MQALPCSQMPVLPQILPSLQSKSLLQGGGPASGTPESTGSTILASHAPVLQVWSEPQAGAQRTGGATLRVRRGADAFSLVGATAGTVLRAALLLTSGGEGDEKAHQASEDREAKVSGNHGVEGPREGRPDGGLP